MFGLRSPRVALVALTIGLAACVSGGALAVRRSRPQRRRTRPRSSSTPGRPCTGSSSRSARTRSRASTRCERAGAGPVVYAMGPGGAVCRLYGVGRDPGPNCLGGPGRRQPVLGVLPGAGGDVEVHLLVGRGRPSRVHDGDVEGWKFGTGIAPAYVSLASLAPPPPAPTSPPATVAPAPASGSGGSSAPVGDGGAAPVSGAEKVTGQPAPGTATTSSTTRLRPRLPQRRAVRRTRRSPPSRRTARSITRPTRTASRSTPSSPAQTTAVAVGRAGR